MLANTSGCARDLRVDDFDVCFRELVAGFAEQATTATCAEAAFPVVPACDALFECDEFASSAIWDLLVDDAQCLWLPSSFDFE